MAENISCNFSNNVETYMYPTAYSLFFIFGLPGNCLSLYVAWILMRRGNSLAVYLIVLSISDLLYIITLPVWIMLAMKQSVNNTLCSVIDVIMYNSFYVGSGLLCCISVDRYLAVVFPLHFARAHKVRTAVLVSILVCLIEISLHIGLLAYTGDLQNFSSSRLCVVKIPLVQRKAHVAIIRVVLSFLVPFLLMVFCFQQIMMSLKQSTSTGTSDRSRIRKLLLLLLVVYFVSFTPFQVVMFVLGLLKPENCDIEILRDSYLVVVATTTINSVLDPVVYCLITVSAKTEIKRLCMICHQQLSKVFPVMRLSSSSTA